MPITVATSMPLNTVVPIIRRLCAPAPVASIIGTIPIGVLGFLFQDVIRDTFRNLWLVAIVLIVFGLLRSALGTPSAPPNQVLLGLALFLTFFIMSPVIDKIYTDAYQPFSEDKISMQVALEKGAQSEPAYLSIQKVARPSKLSFFHKPKQILGFVFSLNLFRLWLLFCFQFDIGPIR